jgi:PAS domain S-box-containing protein
MNRQALEAIGVGVKLTRRTRDLVGRYGVAVALAGLALALRGVLPFREGTAIYQLPIAAVVLSAWYGGRGPGLLASFICITGASYFFVPPLHSFATAPEHVLPLSIFVALCLLLTEFSSGRRRAEHARRASEERFRTLVQFSFDVYWETDARHRFTRQEYAERLAGAPPPELEIGKTRWEVPYLAPGEDAWRRHRAMLDAHLPFRDFELARPNADGTKCYVSVSGIPVFDDSGDFVGYRGVGRDITERKRAEDEHREHLRFLESLDRVNRAIQGTSNLEQMMNDVLGAVRSIFECDRAVLGRHTGKPDTRSFLLLAKAERPGFELNVPTGVEYPADEAFSAMSAALKAAGGPVQWVLGSVPPQLERFLAAFGVQSALAMAIEPKIERPDWVFAFTVRQCTYPRAWTVEEMRLFQEIGRRLGDAVLVLSALRDLRQSEARLEEAQRLAHVGWWARDYATGRVSLSEEACRIFGVRPVDLPHWQERWVSLIHPDDRRKTAEASEIALRGGARYEVEYRVVRPDGAVRVVHSQGDVTWDESQRPLRQFGVLQDITELRRVEGELRASEARFRTFVDHAMDAFFLLDEKLTVVDVNRQACESLGWSREELIGMHPREFDVALDNASIEALAQRAGAGEIINFETRHRRKDGSVFPVEIRTSTFEQSGKLFYLALSRDITERKRAEESMRATDNALQTARTELARVSRLTTLGELTASIAHEVNQPLGAMVTNAGACARWLAANPPNMEEARATLAHIAADGKRAGEIIGRIRALTKRQLPRMESLDMNRKVLEVVALAEHELRSRDIVLRTELDTTLPRVAGDRVQLQQVLLNLIVNAIEAMSEIVDRPRLLTIVTARSGSNAVLVEVRDSGPGFSSDRAERLFEAFYTTKTEGIGIGLSISRSIVEAHGGRLWAASNEPHGAVFRLSLPTLQQGVA